MSTLQQNAMLLRINKQELVKALQEIGFADVSYATPLSELAEYMKWAGGLRDLQLACMSKITGEKIYITTSEWDSMTSNQRTQYVKVGVRIRANKLDFVIAKEDCTSGSTNTFVWGPTNIDVGNLKNYANGSVGLYDDFDGYGNTQKILAQATASSKSFPAAEAASSYKGCTLNAELVEDTHVWCLPSLGQLLFFYRYKTELNEFLTTYFGASYKIAETNYWSSTEHSASLAWGVTMHNGCIGTSNNKSSALRVRAVSAI